MGVVMGMGMGMGMGSWMQSEPNPNQTRQPSPDRHISASPARDKPIQFFSAYTGNLIRGTLGNHLRTGTHTFGSVLPGTSLSNSFLHTLAI
jgi:hypothetical protein